VSNQNAQNFKPLKEVDPFEVTDEFIDLNAKAYCSQLVPHEN